ncbi:MAG: DegV domain-containing protein [Stenotrophomonas maltophilia]|nr:MAG: DegV domain-containing protein [Stenotrophomonas maltophilia]
MRIGLVVDATCDLPPEFLAANNIRVLPIGIRVGERRIIDDRNPETTLRFYAHDLPKVAPEDGSQPLTASETHAWFLENLVTDFDYVICLTVSSARSPIFDNATQASFSLLQTYKERRSAAGISGPFALRVIDSHTVFAGLAVLAAEGTRLLAADTHPNAVRTRLEQLSQQMNTFLVASDLGHIRRRGFQKGDRSSIGDRLRGAFLGIGSMLDMKPVLSLVQGEDKPVSVSPNYEKSAERLMNFARARVEAGELLAPILSMSYAGDPSALRDLPGFAALESACLDRGIAVHLGMLSPVGGINLGSGAMSLSFAAEPKPFA